MAALAPVQSACSLGSGPVSDRTGSGWWQIAGPTGLVFDVFG